MKLYKFLFLSFLVIVASCSGPKERVEVIKIEGLQNLIAERNHEVHVINFWATWCKPCVKEMPQFIELAEAHPEVTISLVSLDYLDNLDDKVIPYLDKKEIKLRTLLMDEIDYNLWIDMVDPSWSGAIPSTLIIEPATGKRIFLEKEFENGELEEDFQKFINS
jgi:thiol-disulfide isomerase/thioredoxin